MGKINNGDLTAEGLLGRRLNRHRKHRCLTSNGGIELKTLAGGITNKGDLKALAIKFGARDQINNEGAITTNNNAVFFSKTGGLKNMGEVKAGKVLVALGVIWKHI